MSDIQALLLLAKDTARLSYRRLAKLQKKNTVQYKYSKQVSREMKAAADSIIEDEIIRHLAPTGLAILSEECGEISSNSNSNSKLRFIVDPIDGTVNFIRGICSSGISIALFDKDRPLFGVIIVYPSGDMAWGGKEIGAYINDIPMQVSEISDVSKSVLCTGIPSRFNLDNNHNILNLNNLLIKFGKVRMLGSASISLLQVAKGSAEFYTEQDIMLWDIAAGLAIVEGAGGEISMLPGNYKYSFNVFASNGIVGHNLISK